MNSRRTPCLFKRPPHGELALPEIPLINLAYVRFTNLRLEVSDNRTTHLANGLLKLLVNAPNLWVFPQLKGPNEEALCLLDVAHMFRNQCLIV